MMNVQDSRTPSLSMEPFGGAEDFVSRWNEVDVLVLPHGERDRYVTGFASSNRCVEEALRLRYEVFNLELGEGLRESAATGLDRDEFDDQMTHLVLLERASGRVVGTYRLQTVKHGLAHRGLYSAGEYDLSPLTAYFDDTVESGRACLAAEHRIFSALMLIWLGIGAFMNLYGQRYVFGCCSLTTRDPDEGWRALKTIRKEGHLHDSLYARANRDYSCGEPSREFAAELGPAIALPKLFRTYMRLGAKVISEPAIDHRFGTVDFLVLQDSKEVSLSRLDVVK